MINHLSSKSLMYQDFKKNHNNSQYKDFFLRWEKFWQQVGPNRPTKQDVDSIYKRKDKAPTHLIEFDDGTTEHLWNTFGTDQIDLNVKEPIVKEFIKTTLTNMVKQGASIIRLDAFAYACKKADTSFFVEPDIWQLLDEVRDVLKPLDVELLPEIHENHSISHKISEHGYFIYDFALPLVVLYTLYSKNPQRLVEWLKKSPMKKFTTLDTHDGIGVIDAYDILTDKEIKYTSEQLYKQGANVKKVYSSSLYNNLDIYQINFTYYSALGNDDDAYLLSRAFQIFAPGIPQVYYVCLFAGENDIKLLESSKEGRNTNRHYYSRQEIKEEVKRPVVANLFKLLAWRNKSNAFDLDGVMECSAYASKIKILRKDKLGNNVAVLDADLMNKKFVIVENDKQIFSN